MQKDFAIKRSSVKKFAIKAGIKFLLKNNTNYKKYYTNFGRTKMNLIKNDLKKLESHFNNNKSYIYENLSKNICQNQLKDLLKNL